MSGLSAPTPTTVGAPEAPHVSTEYSHGWGNKPDSAIYDLIQMIIEAGSASQMSDAVMNQPRYL